MTDQEKRDFLVANLLDVYSKCNMSASRCEKPSLSFFEKMRGKIVPSYYPDIVINNYHGTKGQTAYYIVLPKGASVGNLDIYQLPDFMRISYIKIIYGSVFCLEEQVSERYVKGCHYAAQYISKAVTPVQTNNPLPRVYNDQQLASLYAQAWKNLDASIIKDYLDKDFHYSNDSIFDDMASRDEYLEYLQAKFKVLQRTQSIIKVQLGRNEGTGGWAVLVKQIQNDGTPIVCGIFVESSNGRIMSVEIREMNLPNF